MSIVKTFDYAAILRAALDGPTQLPRITPSLPSFPGPCRGLRRGLIGFYWILCRFPKTPPIIPLALFFAVQRASRGGPTLARIRGGLPPYANLCMCMRLHRFALCPAAAPPTGSPRRCLRFLALAGAVAGARAFPPGSPPRPSSSPPRASQGLPGPPRASRRGPGSRPGDHRRGPRSPNSPPIAQPIKKPYISLKICKKQGFFPSFPFISAFLCLC